MRSFLWTPRPQIRYAAANVRTFSTSRVAPLALAFDLHEPPNRKPGDRLGPPIIFIHGLFGSKKNNRTMSRIFARSLQRPVYAIDLRNHGDSPHNAQHDYPSMASDVEEFIATHELKRPTIIGHSMGAKVAMTIALQNPSLVANLIPVDNAPIDALLKSDFGSYLEGMKKIEAAGVQKTKEADEILEPYEKSLPIRQFLLTNLIRSNATPDSESKTQLRFRIPLDVMSKSLDKMGDFPFRDPETHRYEGPTLFVRGTKSTYVADDVLPAIGQFFPRFELRDIDAGHWVISENPDAFKEAVEEWLRDKD